MFGLSRQGIYQQEKRSHFREQQLLKVKLLVQRERMLMPRIGTRKLYHLLKDDFLSEGVKIGRDALFSYLKKEHLLVSPAKNYTKTTHSKHWLRKHPNLYQGRILQKPEEVFVSDITYIKTKERTAYLSLVTDAYSRKIMGYHLSDDMSSENVVKALKMAINKRRTKNELIHHSDRGLQYCSSIYQECLKDHSITPSMTDGYDCYQNALAERINGILKSEFLIHKCNNTKELQKMVRQSVMIYNTKRPHLSLNMKTPESFHKKTCEASFTG